MCKKKLEVMMSKISKLAILFFVWIFFSGFSISKNNNSQIVFFEEEFVPNSQGLVTIKGTLTNSTGGEFEANIDREKTIVTVASDGNFEFDYNIKNVEDPNVYIGILNERNEVVVNTAKINNTELKIQSAEEKQYTSDDVIKELIENGRGTNNCQVIMTEELTFLPILPRTASSYELEAGNDRKMVRIFTFSNSKDLDVDYRYFLSLNSSSFSIDSRSVLENGNEPEPLTTKFNGISNQLSATHRFYQNNESPYSFSWLIVNQEKKILVQLDPAISYNQFDSVNQVIVNLPEKSCSGL